VHSVNRTGLLACVALAAASAQEPAKVNFLRDVAPILNKVGCTSGPCHGAAKGKNGFKLSLRGYDPQFDYDYSDMDGHTTVDKVDFTFV